MKDNAKPLTPEQDAALDVVWEMIDFERYYAEVEGYEWLPQLAKDDPLVKAVQNLKALFPLEEFPVPGKTLWRRFFLACRK